MNEGIELHEGLAQLVYLLILHHDADGLDGLPLNLLPLVNCARQEEVETLLRLPVGSIPLLLGLRMKQEL